MLLNMFIYGFALVLDVKLSVLEVFFFFFFFFWFISIRLQMESQFGEL